MRKNVISLAILVSMFAGHAAYAGKFSDDLTVIYERESERSRNVDEKYYLHRYNDSAKVGKVIILSSLLFVPGIVYGGSFLCGKLLANKEGGGYGYDAKKKKKFYGALQKQASRNLYNLYKVVSFFRTLEMTKSDLTTWEKNNFDPSKDGGEFYETLKRISSNGAISPKEIVEKMIAMNESGAFNGIIAAITPMNLAGIPKDKLHKANIIFPDNIMGMVEAEFSKSLQGNSQVAKSAGKSAPIPSTIVAKMAENEAELACDGFDEWAPSAQAPGPVAQVQPSSVSSRADVASFELLGSQIHNVPALEEFFPKPNSSQSSASSAAK